MSAERFELRTPADANCTDEKHHLFGHAKDNFDFYFDHPKHHHGFDFVVTFNPEAAFGIVDNVGGASASLDLHGIGNVIVGDTNAAADVSIHGGNGLSTVVLGNGNDHVTLQGAFNTIVLGDGNDVVNAGIATASADFHNGEVHITYGNDFSATFASPLDLNGIHSTSGNHFDIGFFNSGTGNIGAFNGLGNSSASDGNYNIGVFNGDGNGGTENGNYNIGAFNGNFNGLGNASRSDGNDNGNGNLGVLNGNYNGNLNTGLDSGNGNGNGNIGVDSGNLNGNGAATVALHGGMGPNAHLVGGFDTIIVGNGSDSISALAGISTIVAGNGNDQILIGGSYNTVVAGNGADHVVGVNIDHTSITLGNGGCTVNLTGGGCNTVTTGSGNDVIFLSGTGNWVDAGAADTFNMIFGGAGKDTFVLAPSGSGMDKIYNFNLSNGDQLDLKNVLSGTHWDGKVSDMSHFLMTEIVGRNTFLECVTTSGGTATVAELMDTHYSLAMLEAHNGLLV
ncbi:MAG: hypothetical protein QOF07_2136 [Bradyrhizobium sp.]|jgi:hypothetical protein|nr:hypothetical protein [Bradyrhizobium sp.]